MTSELLAPLDRLKTALADVRENRATFSEETYTTLVTALLDHIRRLQTTASTTGAMTDEIRLVTVIFVDVKDSTQLVQDMDTGDFKNVLEEAHRRMTEIVMEWDGTIGQYLGDGVLAFFGAQRSRGDDALRCVACAMAVQVAIEAYANEVFLAHGVEFGVRIGISTGRLVVGMIGGADRQELLAVGPATNLAARLQAEAPPGGIYVDCTTYNRVRDHFNLRARPMLHVKGFEEAILVYQVQGRSNNPSTQLSHTTLGTLPVPLVGREDVLAEINASVLSALQTNTLHVVTIIGEIGMGKSHVLQETTQKLDQDHFLRLQMVAHYELRARPHNLLRNFLIRYCNLTDAMSSEDACQQIVQTVMNTWNDEHAASVASLVGYLAGYGFENDPFVSSLMLSSHHNLLSAYRWVARLLRGIAQQNRLPIVLLVDNVQWADPASIALLEFLATDLHDQPWTFLLASRPVLDTLYPTYMATVSPHRRLTLDRLSDETTRRMIETILAPMERVPPRVVTLIVERAQGNPLFVMEFLSLLFDNGVFHHGRDGLWRFNLVLYESTCKHLPAGLIEVIQSRLDDLSPDVRLILQLAAVAGQMFWKDIVDEMAERDQSDTLDLLQMRGIIVLDADSTLEGETQYHFRHSLYRDVAYEMLPRARREIHHRQVSKWLITRIAGKPDFFSILADQFEAGGEEEAALYTYLEAAQNRLQRGLLPETLSLIDRALAMARIIPREVAISITVQLWTLQAQALIGLERFSEATASAQSALRLFSEMPLSVLKVKRVNAMRLLAHGYLSLGDYEQARDAIQQAYDWTDDSDHVTMAAVSRVFGWLHLQRGAYEEALIWSQRALTNALATGDPQPVVAAWCDLGEITLERGLMGDALKYLEQCLEDSFSSGDIYYQISDMVSISLIYLNLQRLTRAETVIETAHQLSIEINHPETLLEMYRVLVRLLQHRDPADLTEMRHLVARQHRDFYTQFRVRLALMDGLLWMNEYVAVRQLAEQFLPEVQLVNPVLYARTLLRLGRAKAALGDEDAVAILRAAAAAEQTLGGRETCQAYVWLAEADPEHAQAAYQVALDQIHLIAASLENWPDLRYSFLDAPLVAQVRNALQP